MILVVVDGLGPVLVVIWELLDGDQIIAQLSNADKFLKRFLKLCEFCNANFDSFFSTFFSFGFCIFGHPFTNIAWNFG
jgi:hypothetical protein